MNGLMFLAQSTATFLDRLEIVATSELALVGYVVLVVAFAFRWWLGRHAKLIKLAHGVSKKDLPAVIRLLALKMPDPLTDVHERIILQKVGDGYIFIHRLLLEHFAALDQGQ